jgi:hypothetical protein
MRFQLNPRRVRKLKVCHLLDHSSANRRTKPSIEAQLYALIQFFHRPKDADFFGLIERLFLCFWDRLAG